MAANQDQVENQTTPTRWEGDAEGEESGGSTTTSASESDYLPEGYLLSLSFDPVSSKTVVEVSSSQ